MRPLFELIVEEAHRKASNPAKEAAPLRSTKPKLRRWLTRRRKPSLQGSQNQQDSHPAKAASPPSPTNKSSRSTDYGSARLETLSVSCNLSDYGSATDSLSCLSFNVGSDEWQGDRLLALPCLQEDGEHYLELAITLDMMELCVSQASAERDMALSQATFDLHAAIESMCSRLHQLEQVCRQLNYMALMDGDGGIE